MVLKISILFLLKLEFLSSKYTKIFQQEDFKSAKNLGVSGGTCCFGFFITTPLAVCLRQAKEQMLHISDEYAGHNLPGGRLALSLHEEWLATGGKDGRLTFRQIVVLVRIRSSSFLLICNIRAPALI